MIVTCPHCEQELTPEELRTVWSRYTHSLKTNFTPGPGRPRLTKKDRCPCGAMSKWRAAERNHICVAPRRKRATRRAA